MTDYRGSIIVGLGDADDGMPELEWAAREAVSGHRALHVVRAYRWAVGVMPWETSADRAIADDLRAAAEARLEHAVAHVRAGWPDLAVTAEAVDGVAWDVLVEGSRTADLTVLGSRRLSAIGAAVLGSVSTVVAARATGTVVVVEGPSGVPAEDPRVVVGVDGSPTGDAALAFAFDYASRHGRAVLAVFCWPPDIIAAMQWRPEQPAPERAERWLAEAVAGWQEKFPEVEVHRAVVRDHPVAGLVHESTAQELLVVGGRAAHARTASLLGSVSQGVLHHATCPVAVVHARSES